MGTTGKTAGGLSFTRGTGLSDYIEISAKEYLGKKGDLSEWFWNAFDYADGSWNCRINHDSVYKSYKKLTAPHPKVYGYFFVTK